MQGIAIHAERDKVTVCDRRDGRGFVWNAADVVILCHRVTCDNVASQFVKRNGEAVCVECATARFHSHELVDTRGDDVAIVACVCGETLDSAPSNGPYTLGDVVCEYRTCMHCKSTRAYMPAPVVKGRKVALYIDTSTSEASGEWDDLLDALALDDPGVGAPELPPAGSELRRNGVVLARVVEGPTGARAWLVEKPVREIPSAV